MAERYRAFMKICDEWPLEPTKKGRDLGLFIRRKVVTVFKHGDATVVDQGKCTEEYESLRRVQTNVYKHQYPSRRTHGALGLTADQCKTLTSDKTIQEISVSEKNF